MRITMALLTAALLSTSCGLNNQAGKRPPDTDDDQPVELGDTTVLPPARAEERALTVLSYPLGDGIKKVSDTEYYIQMVDNYLPACVEEGKKAKKPTKVKGKEWHVKLSGEGKQLKVEWDSQLKRIRIYGPATGQTSTQVSYYFMPDSKVLTADAAESLAEGTPQTKDRYLTIHTCPNGMCSDKKLCQ
jgi:hypothetical protein